MSTGELLQLLGSGMLAFALLAGAWTLGHVHADRKLEREYTEKLEGLNRLETLRRNAHSAPVHIAEGRVPVDPDATREIRIPPYMRMPDTPHRRNHRTYRGR